MYVCMNVCMYVCMYVWQSSHECVVGKAAMRVCGGQDKKLIACELMLPRSESTKWHAVAKRQHVIHTHIYIHTRTCTHTYTHTAHKLPLLVFFENEFPPKLEKFKMKNRQLWLVVIFCLDMEICFVFVEMRWALHRMNRGDLVETGIFLVESCFIRS